jgi:hypothetical protein
MGLNEEVKYYIKQLKYRYINRKDAPPLQGKIIHSMRFVVHTIT